MKCHGRRLLYTFSEDMTDFLCERCRYIIDNSPNPTEIRHKFQCRFCSEEKGIKIYIDNLHSAGSTNLKPLATISIGWTHLSCIFWNNWLEFVDETKLEVKQDPKFKLLKTQKCKYCNQDSTLFPVTNCGFK